MAAQAKPRRRIVPEQVVPTSPVSPEAAGVPTPSAAALEVADLRQQAERAPTLLGPGRKIWVDLGPYRGQDVNWKKVGGANQGRASGLHWGRCMQQCARASPTVQCGGRTRLLCAKRQRDHCQRTP